MTRSTSAAIPAFRALLAALLLAGCSALHGAATAPTPQAE